MKQIDFSQSGGMPIDQETFAFMQDSYNQIREALKGAIFNSTVFAEEYQEATIISGCNIVGGTIKAGVVMINGVLYPFAEGSGDSDSWIGIQETSTAVEFEDEDEHTIYSSKVAVILPGEEDGAVQHKNFRKITALSDLTILEKGTVSKAAITNYGPANGIFTINLQNTYTAAAYKIEYTLRWVGEGLPPAGYGHMIIEKADTYFRLSWSGDFDHINDNLYVDYKILRP